MPRRTKPAWVGEEPNKHLTWEPINEWEGDFRYDQGEAVVDMMGRHIMKGQWVARAYQSGNRCNLEIRQVTKVYDGKVYLGTSRTPLEYPGRTYILDGPPGPLV